MLAKLSTVFAKQQAQGQLNIRILRSFHESAMLGSNTKGLEAISAILGWQE
jgi:hypothetical protein